MAADLQMFLFLFKSKYRRKCYFRQGVLYLFVAFSCYVSVVNSGKCSEVQCVNGACVNGTCVCFDGWQGSSCQFCGGKVRLSEPSGHISDGKGNYSIDVKCTWLIDSGMPNTSIRLHLEEFATECGWDHLYIYDGDSVQSPLLAVFSGLMYKQGYSIRRIPEVVAHSGSALLHFYSDVAYNMTGFNISYRFDSCPSALSSSNCSGHGVCIDGVCTCDATYTGEACDIPICPRNCSYPRGECDREGHHCSCTTGFKGPDCSQEASLGYWESVPRIGFQPEGSASHGAVVWKDSLYIVGGESYGRAKMVYMYDFYGNVWETPQMSGTNIPRPRYGHSAVLFGDKIFMYGGVEENGLVSGELWAYDINSQTWENITVRLEPCGRGGVSSEQGVNHTGTVIVALLPCGPLRSAGHTATLVPGHLSRRSDMMVVIFGHSPIYGYLNTVQEYHFGTREWNIVSTRGYPVKGGYGHTAAWDALRQRIYVHGGYVSDSSSTPLLSGALFSYDPYSHVWEHLTPAPSARFLHSAVVIRGLVLFFGGNTHNDTAFSHGAKCYSSDFFAYDPVCDKWVMNPGRVSYSSYPPVPGHTSHPAPPRFGHSTVVFKGSAYVYGGFDGQMLSDLLSYTPGNCSHFKDAESCLKASPGVKCIWVGGQNAREENAVGRGASNLYVGSIMDGHCEVISEATLSPNEGSGVILCPEDLEPDYSMSMPDVDSVPTVSTTLSPSLSSAVAPSLPPLEKDGESAGFCSSLHSCASCVQTSKKCTWCRRTAICVHGSCKDGFKGITLLGQCDRQDSLVCSQLHNCQACTGFSHCRWDYESRCKTTLSEMHGQSDAAVDGLAAPSATEVMVDSPSAAAVGIGSDISVEGVICNTPCSELTSCMNCTVEECIWCQNEGRCVDKNAYTASFPYGQCREWTTHQGRCRSTLPGKSPCSFYPTCEDCRADPACGWCDDGSGTGLGACLPGGYSEPLGPQYTCQPNHWYFTHCPTCQCNGHSTCSNGTSVCNQPCANLTHGAHCQHCVPGYYGNPINGGRCIPCECNGQGTQCHPETGKCYCTTKGIVGDHCERCDTQNHYFGDPTDHGSCFYDLTIDYQFTFNLSKKEDRHYTQINFKNNPPKPDVDADFHISCSVYAKMNISIKTANSPERYLVTDKNCSTFRSRFAKSEYSFGTEDNVTLTTFHVYVYDFHPPLWIQISFSQYPKLNLQQFFITFSTCFLLLLLAAALLWKIKQKYDMYRRRQRLFVEMEQMASRPFSQVLVEIEPREGGGGDADDATAEVDDDCEEEEDLEVRGRSSGAGDWTEEGWRRKGGGSSQGSNPGGGGGKGSKGRRNGGSKQPSPGVNLQPATAAVEVATATLRKRKKDSPSPIALEPCSGNRAAVLSLLIRLPTGGETYTPPGQSGLAIASALVTLGNPRKSSIDPTGKSDSKTKTRKSMNSQHPDSCI
ncbi:attractin-like protein 1 isoform X2 [Ischnura elegans]|uniref:attractin-like protein 1 isoform X2 n=1 Tax=Ischnura elegans TaxID=197161 RepID=UPI001ED87955|nr:attractin-like protein 1 isoform X2 [Ischnura elegans]